MDVRWGLVALAVVLLAPSAAAEDSRTFRLAYSAAAGCPTEGAFLAAIESNSARARRVSEGEAAIEIDVVATPESGGFVGVLRLRRPDGTETTRSVPAAACTEVVSAMALIASIAIDPDGATAPLQRETVAAPEASSVSPAPSAPAPPPPPPEPPPLPGRNGPPLLAKEDAKSLARGWWLGAHAGIGLTSAMAPGISPDFHLGVGVGAARKTLWSPLARLSGHLAEGPQASNGEGAARFERLGGRLTGCPLMLDATLMSLRPCALFEVGQLRAKGTGTETHATTAVPIFWLALGATLRGELHLAGPLTLAAETGALFPLVHDTFFFNPSKATLLHVSDVGFLGALELGVQIL